MYLLSYIFRLNTIKGTAKSPAVDLERQNTLRGTKTDTFVSLSQSDDYFVRSMANDMQLINVAYERTLETFN